MRIRVGVNMSRHDNSAILLESSVSSPYISYDRTCNRDAMQDQTATSLESITASGHVSFTASATITTT
jgi:hypothetical protein